MGDGLWARLHVLEARVPETRVKVAMREEPHVIGGEAHAEIVGETYSGAPLAGARLRWSVEGWPTRSNRFSDHAAYQFSHVPEPAEEATASEEPPLYQRRGEAALDSTGHLTLAVPLAKDCAGPDACGFSLEVEAIDALQHGVAAHTAFTAYAVPVVVGLKSESTPSSSGRSVRIEAIVLDTQGREQAIPVELRMLERRALLDPGAGPRDEEIEIAHAKAPASFFVL